MSKSEKIINFEEALKKDEAKQKAYEDAAKKLSKDKSIKSNGELMSKVAKELGYDISVEECERLFAEKQEMDDDELEKVAGGWCTFSHGCHYVISHSDKVDTSEDCWKEYICLIADYI